jgi:hypothetical protein
MKCSAPLALLVVGILIVCGAIFYGVLLVGVPTPDATPAIAAAEARVERVTNWWMGGGGILVLIGMVWLCACRILRGRARDAQGGGAEG